MDIRRCVNFLGGRLQTALQIPNFDSIAKSQEAHNGDAGSAEARGDFLLNPSACLRELRGSAVKFSFFHWTHFFGIQ